MKTERWWSLLLVVSAFAWVVSAAFAISDAKENVMVVGKKGVVTFPVQTKVGDLLLPPGRYRLQHRVEKSEHFVEFTPVNKIDARTIGPASRATCRLEPLGEKASQTAVNWVKDGDGNRLTQIKVEGENVVHLF